MADAAKPPGDFLRLYVIVMALFAGFLAFLWRKREAEADAYAVANAAAPRVFGTERAGDAPPPDATPTTVRGLAVGVLKYLETKKAAGKTEGGKDISTATIRERLSGANLRQRSLTEDTDKVENVRYRFEEISVQLSLEESNLNDLSTFLYNVEAGSPNLRILQVNWELRPDAKNPYAPGVSPGHLILGPTVKIGFRRPLTGPRRGG